MKHELEDVEVRLGEKLTRYRWRCSCRRVGALVGSDFAARDGHDWHVRNQARKGARS